MVFIFLHPKMQSYLLLVSHTTANKTTTVLYVNQHATMAGEAFQDDDDGLPLSMERCSVVRSDEEADV